MDPVTLGIAAWKIGSFIGERIAENEGTRTKTGILTLNNATSSKISYAICFGMGEESSSVGWFSIKPGEQAVQRLTLPSYGWRFAYTARGGARKGRRGFGLDQHIFHVLDPSAFAIAKSRLKSATLERGTGKKKVVGGIRLFMTGDYTYTFVKP